MRIFLRISALYWKYWRRALVTYVCLLAGAVLALLIPRLTGQAIDLALGASQTLALVFTALGIGAAGLFRSFLSYEQSYLGEYLSQKVAYDLRARFYDHLQRLSYAFHDRSQTGQLMSRATSDIEEVRMFVGFALLRGVYFLVVMLAIVVLLLLLDWKLALMCLWVLPIITYRTIQINSRLRLLWAKIQQGIGVLGTIVQENLTGVKVVRSFAREDYESQKYRQQAQQIYEQEIQANNLLAVNSPIMSFLLLLGLAAILWYGGRQVIAGELTQGELAQFLLYLVMLSMPVRMLGWLTTLYSRAMASGQRIYEILDEVSPVRDNPGSKNLDQVKGHIVFEKVSFGYQAHSPTLTEVSFEAKPGQIIALVGASGSGKSTIVNLIPRFYDVTAGRITLDGMDIREITLASLRRHIGMVHQDTFLFSASFRENISYGKPDASLEEIIKVARIAHLHDFITSLPQGYETQIGERGINLSGGQKQRLAIARTILLNPAVLIMDDSTASVDSETEYLIRQTLAGALAGRTTYIIAHRLRSVQIADVILVLKDGQIVERGTHNELLAKKGIYRQLYSLQFENEEHAAATPAPLRLTEKISGTGKTSDENPGQNNGNGQPPRDESLSGSDEIVWGKPYDSRVIARISSYFTAYKMPMILTVLATLLFTFSSVANPYIIGIAENNYILTGDLNGLNRIVLLFVGMAVLNLVSYYTQIRAEALLGQNVMLKLRSRMFEHLQKLSLRFISHNQIGRIISRVQSDVGELGDFLDSGAFWVVGEVATLVSIMVVMLSMHLKLGLITLSVIPLLLAFVIFWQIRARRSYIKVRQAISRVNAALEENISGVRVIQSLSREELNSRRFDEINQANFEANIGAAKVSAAMMPGVELLVSAATALIIFFGGLEVANQALLVGTLIAFVLYINHFFDPIRTLTYEYGQLQRAMASGARIFELLDVKPGEPATGASLPAPRLKGRIEFQQVSFSYEPGIEVIHDLSLTIPAGQTVALVGPTGAGKSTLFSLIERFYRADHGRILVDGYDLNQLEIKSYRGQIGLVLQDPFLFSGTIKENIRYGNLEASEQSIIEAAQAAGIHEFIIGLEQGYDTRVQEHGQNFSMGQRQLISFARALVADPAIVLLDEATASIDSSSEQQLQQGLNRLMQGRTTLVIAHRLSTIRQADNIVVLDNGRIAEQGRHEDLLARKGLYYRLHEMTFATAGAT